MAIWVCGMWVCWDQLNLCGVGGEGDSEDEGMIYEGLISVMR